MNSLTRLTTLSEPVPGDTGDFLTVAPGRSIIEALGRVEATVGNAGAVLDQIPNSPFQAELLASAAAELLYTARALLASVNSALQGETEDEVAA